MPQPANLEDALDLFNVELLRQLSTPAIKYSPSFQQQTDGLLKLLQMNKSNAPNPVAEPVGANVGKLQLYQETLALYRKLRTTPGQTALASQLLNCLYYAVSFTNVRQQCAELWVAFETSWGDKAKPIIKKAGPLLEFEDIMASLLDLSALKGLEGKDFADKIEQIDSQLRVGVIDFVKRYQQASKCPKAIVVVLSVYRANPYSVNKGMSLSPYQVEIARQFYDDLKQKDHDAPTSADMWGFTEDHGQDFAEREFALGYKQLLKLDMINDVTDLKKYALLQHAIEYRHVFNHERHATNYKYKNLVAAVDAIFLGSSLRKLIFRMTQNRLRNKNKTVQDHARAWYAKIKNPAATDNDLLVELKTEYHQPNLPKSCRAALEQVLTEHRQNEQLIEIPGSLYFTDVEPKADAIDKMPIDRPDDMLKQLQKDFNRASHAWQLFLVMTSDPTAVKKPGDINLDPELAKFADPVTETQSILVSNVGLANNPAYVSVSIGLAVNLFDAYQLLSASYETLSGRYKQVKSRIDGVDLISLERTESYQKRATLCHMWFNYYSQYANEIKNRANAHESKMTQSRQQLINRDNDKKRIRLQVEQERREREAEQERREREAEQERREREAEQERREREAEQERREREAEQKRRERDTSQAPMLSLDALIPQPDQLQATNTNTTPASLVDEQDNHDAGVMLEASEDSLKLGSIDAEKAREMTEKASTAIKEGVLAFAEGSVSIWGKLKKATAKVVDDYKVDQEVKRRLEAEKKQQSDAAAQTPANGKPSAVLKK